MSDSVYKIVELVGTSTESWEQAAKNVVELAAGHLKDLRVAEVDMFDMHIEAGKPIVYRAKLKLSFKYHEEL
ncbi:MAG: dodecin family protein [Caldilineaceae bacterium]